MVTVSPSPADLLTCTQTTFKAGVTGVQDASVDWSLLANPTTGTGSIDAKGVYTAPLTVPAKASIVVEATSKADPTAKADANVTLATAHVSPPIDVTGALHPDNGGNYTRWVAKNGARVYAVALYADAMGNSRLDVVRSDDGGATTKVMGNANLLPDPTLAVTHAAIAVDPKDPDLVYVAYKTGHGSEGWTKISQVGSDAGGSIILATSHDGGKTFTGSLVWSGGNGYCNYLDLVASAPNTMTLVCPSGGWGELDGHALNVDTFVSDQAGADLDGNTTQGDFVQGVRYDGLSSVPFYIVVQNTANAGAVLTTDGAGRVCATYIAELKTSDPYAIYVQCSKDAGKTFSAPVLVGAPDPLLAVGAAPHLAFGPKNDVAVVYANNNGDGFVAWSHDFGASFGQPVKVPNYILPDGTASEFEHGALAYQGDVLWVSHYAFDGGGQDRVVIDKTCDGGQSWSGSLLVNGAEGKLMESDNGGLLASDTGAPIVVLDNYGAASSYQLVHLDP